MTSSIVAVILAAALLLGADRYRGYCRTCGAKRTVVHDSFGTGYVACPSCHYTRVNHA